MDEQTVEQYLLANQKFFPQEKILFLKEKLLNLNEKQFSLLYSMDLKDPLILLIVSICFSCFTNIRIWISISWNACFSIFYNVRIQCNLLHFVFYIICPFICSIVPNIIFGNFLSCFILVFLPFSCFFIYFI